VASFDKAIPPGQEGNITIKVNTGKREGRFSKSATVFSNDLTQPNARISVSCVVKTHITIRPSQRINITGLEGEKISKELTISSSGEQPFEILNITSDIEDKIKYKLKRVKKNNEYTLKVSTRSTEESNFRGTIGLRTNHPKKPQITLPVYAMLKKKVDVRPKALSFGTINITEGNVNQDKLTKRILLVDNGGELTIKKVKTSSDWITTVNKKMERGKNHTILIVLDKDKLPKGSFDEKVEIRTNYGRKPLVVDIKGKVL